MILILGVTASGKGKLACDLAQKVDAEIISVDSMKVYRRMDIGTAKPPPQARQKVKYHLIDVVEPSESFSVGLFLELAKDAIKNIKQRNKSIIAVGGTALYIKALLYGLFEGPGADENIRKKLKQQAKKQGLAALYDQLKAVDLKAADRISPNDARRIIRALEVHQLTGKPISSFQQQWNNSINCPPDKWTIIGLSIKKDIERKRITARVKKMIDTGPVDEVKTLLTKERPLRKQAAAAIGYAEIMEHLKGKTTLQDALELIKINTRRLAKSQRTWFKTFQNVNWLDITENQAPDRILARTEKLLAEKNRHIGKQPEPQA